MAVARLKALSWSSPSQRHTPRPLQLQGAFMNTAPPAHSTARCNSSDVVHHQLSAGSMNCRAESLAMLVRRCLSISTVVWRDDNWRQRSRSAVAGRRCAGAPSRWRRRTMWASHPHGMMRSTRPQSGDFTPRSEPSGGRRRISSPSSFHQRGRSHSSSDMRRAALPGQ